MNAMVRLAIIGISRRKYVGGYEPDYVVRWSGGGKIPAKTRILTPFFGILHFLAPLACQTAQQHPTTRYNFMLSTPKRIPKQSCWW
jgi:hypothetical protein